MKSFILFFLVVFLTISINGETCVDLTDDCIWLMSECHIKTPFVEKNCRRTCRFCHDTGSTAEPCYDTGPYCLDQNICDNSTIAMTTCRFTCGECNSMYTGPTLPAEPDYPDYTTPSSSSNCFNTLSNNGCESMKELCEDPSYKPLMEKECALTCGFC